MNQMRAGLGEGSSTRWVRGLASSLAVGEAMLRAEQAQGGCSLEERSTRLLVLAGVCRLLKLELWRQRPMPRVTRDSSMAFLRTDVKFYFNVNNSCMFIISSIILRVIA